jgi:hypothetical protein
MMAFQSFSIFSSKVAAEANNRHVPFRMRCTRLFQGAYREFNSVIYQRLVRRSIRVLVQSAGNAKVKNCGGHGRNFHSIRSRDCCETGSFQ